MNQDNQPENKLHNVNISAVQPLVTPRSLKDHTPTSSALIDQIQHHRSIIASIIDKKDPRLLMIIGPCSIHDPKAALEYAKKLVRLHMKYHDHFYIVMRVYFEKPRTTIGWKGLINDPDLDNSCDVNEGLTIARGLLHKIAELGLPIGVEMLDPVTPQYTADLVSWAAIGARTTESQTHREMVSGLSMPVGFKNATNGNIQVVCDAIKAARNPHSFIGMNQSGQTSIIRTMGNSNCHLVLRGGSDGPNYSSSHIKEATDLLDESGCPTATMVDCSHANSFKDHTKQSIVWQDVIRQRLEGNTDIIGLMLESNLFPGNQKITSKLEDLAYGVSITDACVGWDETENILEKTYYQFKLGEQ